MTALGLQLGARWLPPEGWLNRSGCTAWHACFWGGCLSESALLQFAPAAAALLSICVISILLERKSEGGCCLQQLLKRGGLVVEGAIGNICCYLIQIRGFAQTPIKGCSVVDAFVQRRTFRLKLYVLVVSSVHLGCSICSFMSGADHVVSLS